MVIYTKEDRNQKNVVVLKQKPNLGDLTITLMGYLVDSQKNMQDQSQNDLRRKRNTLMKKAGRKVIESPIRVG